MPEERKLVSLVFAEVVELERWAADHALAVSREGFGADSIVASP
jgi:hypothetical protein